MKDIRGYIDRRQTFNKNFINYNDFITVLKTIERDLREKDYNFIKKYSFYFNDIHVDFSYDNLKISGHDWSIQINTSNTECCNFSIRHKDVGVGFPMYTPYDKYKSYQEPINYSSFILFNLFSTHFKKTYKNIVTMLAMSMVFDYNIIQFKKHKSARSVVR